MVHAPQEDGQLAQLALALMGSRCVALKPALMSCVQHALASVRRLAPPKRVRLTQPLGQGRGRRRREILRDALAQRELARRLLGKKQLVKRALRKGALRREVLSAAPVEAVKTRARRVALRAVALKLAQARGIADRAVAGKLVMLRAALRGGRLLAQAKPVITGQAGNAQRAAQSRSSQGHTSQGHSGQARSGQGRASQPRTSQGRSGQGRGGQGAASRTGAASTARRARAGGQQQNPRKQAQGAPGKRRVNAPGARPSRPQSQAPERRRPPANRPKKPPRQPMDPALKASLMRLGRNVFLVVLTVVLVVWGFNYVTETVRVQNLQAARQNQGSGMPTPLACDTKNLDVTITLPAQVARGQALTVNLKVANKANIPCIFDVGSEHLQMRVTSGTDTVYDAATCKVEPNSRKMLLAPLTAKAAGESAYVSANPTPDSFTTSVSWNGQRYKADCSSAGPSQAGTYVLRLNLDGKELVGQQVFIVK